jgi:rod shape-determining protein MreB and related proteins
MDIGTANFRAAVAGGNEVIHEPSFVAHDDSGRTIIGTEALQMVGRSPDFINITSPIERGAIRDISAVVQIIQYSAKHFFSHSIARKFDFSLAIPSGLTQVEQRAVEEAGKMAGARQVRLVDASVAAALGAGLPIGEPTGCLVVNLGAGVTEATALSMNGVVGSGRLGVGGRDIDKAIVESIRKRYSLLLGLRSAEELKRRFGEADLETTELEVRGRSLRTGLPEGLLVPRTVVDKQFSDYCEIIVDLIVQTMATCPPEIAGDITERGVILVGGGSMTPGLRAQLASRIDVPVFMAEEPEAAVINGLSQMRVGRNGRMIIDKSDRENVKNGRNLGSIFKLQGFGLSRTPTDLKKAVGEEKMQKPDENR